MSCCRGLPLVLNRQQSVSTVLTAVPVNSGRSAFARSVSSIRLRASSGSRTSTTEEGRNDELRASTHYCPLGCYTFSLFAFSASIQLRN